ncbi:Major outer membrane protein P.IA [Andreprevotia sp. IGB-42]|uniref:porin n=1 Tax=Andreprevotia sp. IGB-42 TaxID=2497473 RepID=UPI00135880DF|nr:porin [Andreprevotia sp. IGB-42]KAF0813193.1 Major outer membrane protein P.IA [Andreprevotia sp. IGB-42]
MKKLIAAAVAAAFVAPVALADVTITGSIRTALDYIDITDATAKADASKNVDKFRIADQSSRITFKGEDKLDDGGTLVWQIENGFNIGVGGSTGLWGTRNTFIGYKSDSLGLLRFGKNDNAYKLASADYIQALDGELNDDSGYLGGKRIIRRLGDRQDQIISYDSPNWGGFRVRASYDLDSGKDDSVNATTGAITASYSNDTFSVGGAYANASDRKISFGSVSLSKDHASATATGTTTQGTQLGGTVKFSGVTLSAAWEHVEWDTGKLSRDQDSFALGALYKVGKFTVHGAYLNAGDVDGLSDTGASQYVIGGQYSLSKQSRIYLTYAQLENDKNAKFTTEGPELSLVNGQDLKILSLGVRSDF